MPLAAGQILQDRYRFVSLLGRGGMGAVYRAWDTRLNAPVALKEMVPQANLDPHLLAQLRWQFQQEATVLAHLRHAHLVRVTDFFEEAGNAYLVMNFVEGESLADCLKREGALAEKQVLAWAEQLLDALAYCHSQGVLHRDVKPQNVIICPDGRAMLVDFGLAKLWDPHDSRTQTAMRGMGTPEYAPPEQYDVGVGHTDHRSDVYSLGATLYHALAGRPPPTATQRIVNPAALVPLRALNPWVSPYVETALMRALELQPEARFQSAAEMSGALKGRLHVTPLLQRATSVPALAKPPSPPTRRLTSWPWIGLAAGAAVLVVVVLVGVILAAVGLSGTWRHFLPLPGPASATPPGKYVPENAPAVADTPTPVPLPTPTSTPLPSPQPTLTPWPTSTLLPTETPTPACPAVSDPFANIWQGVRERLGCAVNQSHTTWMAEEHFERGLMFWREDTDSLSVLYNKGAWAAYSDIWREGDPDYSCPDSAPTESPPTPLRGFGKIWCTYEPVRSGLGWATDGERGYYATAQDFERGSIVRTDGGTTYLLYGDGWWEQR